MLDRAYRPAPAAAGGNSVCNYQCSYLCNAHLLQAAWAVASPVDPTLTASTSLCVQAPPPPPRGSGFDPAQPEELELWQLQQGLAREREYHHVAKRKAGAC